MPMPWIAASQQAAMLSARKRPSTRTASALPAAEAPGFGALHPAAHDAGVAAHLARMLRASMLREVAGCAVDHAAHGAEAVLAQRAVGRLAEAQHQVQARRLGIDQLVAEQQFHLERR